MSGIIEYLYNCKISEKYKNLNEYCNKITKEEKIVVGLENKNEITECSNITECYQITNECCKNINKFRQYERTEDETIIVGLELPNQKGKLIRFVPRNITVITKQG